MKIRHVHEIAFMMHRLTQIGGRGDSLERGGHLVGVNTPTGKVLLLTLLGVSGSKTFFTNSGFSILVMFQIRHTVELSGFQTIHKITPQFTGRQLSHLPAPYVTDEGTQCTQQTRHLMTALHTRPSPRAFSKMRFADFNSKVEH